ncbi:14710_t:CDS:2 [Racocetra fulgida]|uniref:14710_t:CDS:1 n=1 Tax=Racocetra fulgida TaxID=60492 RepID=A0A9N9BTG6_9GLOM|nr:14710_t:CDS:2 [Racocetra fulgida]
MSQMNTVLQTITDAFDDFLEFGSDSPEPITIKDPNQTNKSDITNKIQNLIFHLPLNQPIDAEEYISADNSLITTEILDNEEIIDAVKNCEYIELKDEVINKPISFIEALRFIDRILSFLEQQLDGSFNVDDSFIHNLEKLIKEVKLKYIISQQLLILDSFILGMN